MHANLLVPFGMSSSGYEYQDGAARPHDEKGKVMIRDRKAAARAGDIIAHSGDNPGYKAMAAASVRRQAAFIMMTNGDLGFDQIIAKVVKSEPMQRFLPAILV